MNILTDTERTARKNLAELAIGDILCSTYGYGCTPVNFAVVVYVTEKFVYFREVGREMITGNWMDYQAIPNREDCKSLRAEIKTHTPQQVAKDSTRRSIYYKSRRGELKPRDGIDSGTGAYYTFWDGKPVHGNCN